MTNEATRKIIHIDMDCFYAAIEIRDHPELEGKPVAVGGSSSRRGVLTTCNYEARTFGCHSAMPTFKALQRCPRLVVMPVRFDVYRAESKRIREILAPFTELIEPLSLDEAYLDVSHWRSTGASVALEIRTQIHETTGLTASAGIAPNKLIAKIASDWKKPNGQFEVTPEEVAKFMAALPVRKLWGVGKKTAQRLSNLGIETCGDVLEKSITELHRRLGRFGGELHELSQGVDDRPVQPSRVRKSVSNERTYREDLTNFEQSIPKLQEIWEELVQDLTTHHAKRRIKGAFVKLKFSDFQQTTVERQTSEPKWEIYETLLEEGWQRAEDRHVRLLGAGVRFHSDLDDRDDPGQLALFEDEET
ncbi:MAG: DNA polymerase-4 [Verrucomicrobiales bacterium]|jgi:DNA polymerase-4